MKYKKGLALLLVCFALIGTTWYVYSEGSNTTGVSKTVNESNITYAKGWFKARCGTGSTKSFYRTATK